MCYSQNWNTSTTEVADSDMKIYLGAPRGYCAGVVRAIEVVDIALERYGPPIYVKHEIVHNSHVVNALELKGALTVDDVDDVPEGSTVVFSAHGSPPDDFRRAEVRGLKVIDATCPLVTKVHNEAHKYARDGRRLMLIGHKGHQEVIGSMGQEPMTLVDDRGDMDLPDWDDETPVTVLSQTTLSVDDTERAVEEIKDRFDNVIVRNDLCYATTNRQASVKEMCRHAQLILVIGSRKSSNCNRLREVAEANGVEAHLIDGPHEIEPAWLDGIDSIGVTSGASTPEWLVESVIETLAPDEVITLTSVKEDITFSLPREI